jgi:hypothetical protein
MAGNLGKALDSLCLALLKVVVAYLKYTLSSGGGGARLYGDVAFRSGRDPL